MLCPCEAVADGLLLKCKADLKKLKRALPDKAQLVESAMAEFN